MKFVKFIDFTETWFLVCEIHMPHVTRLVMDSFFTLLQGLNVPGVGYR